MKKGDLVTMPGQYSDVDQLVIGLVVKLPKMIRRRIRIGVLWSDGDGKINYEPVEWLVKKNDG
tara:strand:- start:8156 stop:8344 length:189 start_codon:yes stop_codon:yes gene_type:complete